MTQQYLDYKTLVPRSRDWVNILGSGSRILKKILGTETLQVWFDILYEYGLQKYMSDDGQHMSCSHQGRWSIMVTHELHGN